MARASTSGRAAFAQALRQIGVAAVARAVPELQAQGDQLVAKMQTAAPEQTGKLRRSIRKLPGATDHQVLIVAGGAETTKVVKGHATYEREVKIGQGDTAGIHKAPGGANVTYDYALGVEFGNEHAAGEPFFYPTYRARKKAIWKAILKAAQDGAATVPGVTR